MRDLVDLSDKPRDPIEALLWLSGLDAKVKAEIDHAWQVAYFDARFTNRLDAALGLRLHPLKRVMAWTRRENESRGRYVTKWPDS